MKIKTPEDWHGNVAKHPELYDLLHERTVGDVGMYLRLSESHEMLLECGIGTGRVAIPIARSGIHVCGIDSSPEMLNRLRAKLAQEPPEVSERVTAHQADMRNFSLGMCFSFSFIPFMTFNYLESLQEQSACLDSIRRHLVPGGRLVIELISFYKEWFYDDGIPRRVKELELSDGRRLEVMRVVNFDASTQTMKHKRYYRFFNRVGFLESEQCVELVNRFFFLGEAILLLENSKFRINNVWGNHENGKYDASSQVMILDCEYVARKIRTPLRK